MRAAAVAEAEVAGGEAQRVAGEDVAGPGAGVARPEDRLDLRTPIDGQLGADQRGVGRRARGIVTAAHAHVDVGVAALDEVLLERGESLGSLHIGHEAQVELRDGLVGKDGLPSGARVSANQPLDVDCGAGNQALEGLGP